MSTSNRRNITESEKNVIGQILKDLQFIFNLNEIKASEVKDVLDSIKSEEVRAYIFSLAQGAKPESALREAFLAGNSLLTRYLFGEISPEINLGPGFIDYIIKSKQLILLELKSLFEAEIEESYGVRKLKRLRQKTLQWDEYIDQVVKYVQRGGEFVVLTNLKDWYFFNKTCNLAECRYFHTSDLIKFVKDFDVVGSLSDYLERHEIQVVREDLDKRFFVSLKQWVSKLSDVKFTVDDRQKTELIINLINRFVFIQTLDDYAVVDVRWIKETWDRVEQRWGSKGKYAVIREFFREVTVWFYEFYDTELFRGDILEYVDKSPENIQLLYSNLQLVLGITYWATVVSTFKGIMQYKFKYIDEDIFGKAYETYLAEVRKEQGIYYTPRFVTKLIVDETIGKIFADLTNRIKVRIEQENFTDAERLIHDFCNIKVLDIACGSGSFLIKSIRNIMQHYRTLSEALTNAESKYNRYKGSLLRSKDIEEKMSRICGLREALCATNERDLIGKLLVRHIYGNDLDKKALGVAKVNIWLEAIKLAPGEFRFDKLPAETNHVLPDLEMNLTNGDSLIGLPHDKAIQILAIEHKADLRELSVLRDKYLDSPANSELVEKIERIKAPLRHEMNVAFEQYCIENQLPTDLAEHSIPFHFELEFWFIFFDQNGNPLGPAQRGAHAIIGNPPYGVETNARLTSYMNKEYNVYADRYCLFAERALQLINEGGLLSYITPVSWQTGERYLKTRQYLFRQQPLLILNLPYDIFEDAYVDTGIFVFEKVAKINTTQTVKVYGFPKKADITELTNIPWKEFKVEQAFKDPTLKIYVDTTLYELTEKLSKGLAKTIGDVTESRIGVLASQYRIATQAKGDGWLPFFVGNVYRYEVKLDHYEYIDFRSEKSGYATFFTTVPRILVRRIVNRQDRLMACIDEHPSVVKKDLYVFLVTNPTYDIGFLLALFNSILYSHIYLQTSIISVKDDFRQTTLAELRRLPVPKCTNNDMTKISELSKRMIELLSQRESVMQVWRDWSDKLKTSSLTLVNILANDARITRSGEFEKSWTKSVSFYPTGHWKDNMREFQRVFIDSNIGNLEIAIAGLDQDNEEETIYRMQFKNADLLEHVYASLTDTLEKRLIRNLSQLLERTTVPVITPNHYEATINIIAKMHQILKDEKQITWSLPEVDNIITENEGIIEAGVFKLYVLNRDEAGTIMESLPIRPAFRSRVLSLL